MAVEFSPGVDGPALKTELANARYNGTTGAQAAVLLNDFSSADTLSDRDEIPAAEVMAAIEKGEWESRFAAWTNPQQKWFEFMISAGTVKSASANVQAQFLSLFPNATAPLSRAALIVLVQKKCSRAEKLFGRGVVVYSWDVERARLLP